MHGQATARAAQKRSLHVCRLADEAKCEDARGKRPRTPTCAQEGGLDLCAALDGARRDTCNRPSSSTSPRPVWLCGRNAAPRSARAAERHVPNTSVMTASQIVAITTKSAIICGTPRRLYVGGCTLLKVRSCPASRLPSNEWLHGPDVAANL